MQSSIAVIGMGCIFPDAMNINEYWNNILLGKDSIREIPDSYWLLDDYYNEDKNKRDKTYSKKAGVLNDVAFNPLEFGIMPNDLESISVDQIFALIVAKQALQDAGLYGDNAKQFDRNKTGVILAAGIGKNAFSLNVRLQIPKFRKILLNSGVSEKLTEVILSRMADAEVEWTENSNPGYLPNVVAGRVASRFNLYGTNCTVDAACASSLAALKCAVNELQSGDCDIVLTGSVNLDCSEFSFVSFCKTPAISPNDSVRPFDRDSDGMVLGDGVGMLVLKRLSDAERDRDKIYGVIRGIGSSGDGRAKGIFAPNVDGQIKALQRAYENADVNPKSISLIEAHGTGTKVGDNYELEALKKFLGNYDVKHNIGIGSVKSQIGHTRLAAGSASLIKVLLALHHKIQPGTLHVDNPATVLEDSCIKVLNKARPWIVNDLTPVRRAGVSAFGFGGTNYHVVVEEWRREHDERYRFNNVATNIVVNGDSIEVVLKKCEELKEVFLTDKSVDLHDYYGAVRIPEDNHRLGFAVKSVDEAIEKLDIALKSMKEMVDCKSWEADGIYYRASGVNSKDKISVVFDKPKVQKVNMYQEIAMNFPEIRESIRKADNIRIKAGKRVISELLYPYEDDAVLQDEINKIENALMGASTLSNGLFKILKTRGLKADYYIAWDALEAQAQYANGILKEKECFKQLDKASEKLINKYGNKDCKVLDGIKSKAVIYEKNSKKRCLKEKSTLDDCIEYASEKGTTLFLNFGIGTEESSENRKTLKQQQVEMISICSESNRVTQYELELILVKMRVFGISLEQDKYSDSEHLKKEGSAKHSIIINPRVYRTSKKEKIVHDAIYGKTFIQKEVQERTKKDDMELKVEIAKTSSNEEPIIEEIEISSVQQPVVQTEHVKTVNIQKKKVIKKNNINYIKKREVQEINHDAFVQFLKSQGSDLKRLKEYMKGSNAAENRDKVFVQLKKCGESKLEEFRSYLNRQNTLLVNQKPIIVKHDEQERTSLTRTGMRMLQVTLKEAELEQGNAILIKGISIVVLDCDGVALQVCDRLKQQGFTPVILNIEGITCASTKYPVYNMKALRETDIKDFFEAVRSSNKEPLTGFIYVSSTPREVTQISSEFDTIKALYLSAKYFHLNSDNVLEKDQKKFFINVVRMDGKFGTTGNGENLVLGGLFGLGKSLSDEWGEHTIVKTIDIQSTCSQNVTTDLIMQELLSCNKMYPEVGRIKSGKRYFLGLKETEDVVAAKEVPTENDVFLVSGGGQGITAKCITQLAEKYNSKFVLLGRTALKDDVSWLADCQTKRDIQNSIIAKMRQENKKMKPNEMADLVKSYYSQLMIRNTISNLEAVGSQVAYYTCDVTNEEQVSRVVQDAVSKYGEITGFIHGAGVLADKYIHNKVEKDFDLVAGTKIFGLNACLKSLNLSKMKYIILFSSVAAFFGNKGQSDYSMANEVLNKIAYLLKRCYPKCKTISINWGPWDFGMIDKSLKDALEAREIAVIPIEKGVNIFMEQFAYEQKSMQAQIVVFDKMYF